MLTFEFALLFACRKRKKADHKEVKKKVRRMENKEKCSEPVFPNTDMILLFNCGSRMMKINRTNPFAMRSKKGSLVKKKQ